MSKKTLSNRKLEIVAQQLAKGATAAEASIAAGYRTNGAAFAANCRQRANYPEVKSRVAALQAKAAERLTVDLAWIYERLRTLVDSAHSLERRTAIRRQTPEVRAVCIRKDHESRVQATQRGRITNMRPLLP
jgi:hypothetical protein